MQRICEIKAIKPLILLIIMSATGFGLSYAMVGEKTDVFTVHGYWHQHFAGNLAVFFRIRVKTFQTDRS